MTLFWLSFVCEQTGKFKGVVIIDGKDLSHAIKLSHWYGLNPGGQISAAPISKEQVKLIHRKYIDRLLGKEEANILADYLDSTLDAEQKNKRDEELKKKVYACLEVQRAYMLEDIGKGAWQSCKDQEEFGKILYNLIFYQMNILTELARTTGRNIFALPPSDLEEFKAYRNYTLVLCISKFKEIRKDLSAKENKNA